MTVAPQAWRLDGRDLTAVIAAGAEGPPACVYWGAPLPAGEDLAALAVALTPATPSAVLDSLAPLSLCPEPRRGWLGAPGALLAGPDGPVNAQLALVAAEAGAQALCFELEDAAAGVRLTIELSVDPEIGALTGATTLTAARPLQLDWLAAPVLPVPDHLDALIDFSGRWCGEFQPQRARIRPGAHVREARGGRPGHDAPPFVAFAGPATTVSRGPALGLQLAAAGGHRLVVEATPDGRRQAQFGALTRPGEIRLQPGDSWRSPTLIAAASEDGLGGLARAFHRHYRGAVVRRPDPARPPPVHYNCWEAVYFEHDLARLKDIAARAADLGAERFVLDDGWFQGRRDDARALGDWSVDRGRYPDGLAPLIDHVEALGMRFGLWVEPEMISEDSALYRAHPDWVHGGPIAGQPAGRRQYVLDFGLRPVAEHVFGALDALLAGGRIDYLKWDHNRPVLGPSAAHAAGVLAVLDRLRAAHAAVEIESCASGGGRIDAQILARTHRVWLSDSNDALTRAAMQHHAALMIPPELAGAHVGPRRCHTSGRVLPMAFRAWVAASRHLGFEMDPRDLTPDEAAVLRAVTMWWKRNRDWLFAGDLHLLESADPALLGEMRLSPAGDRFVAFVYQLGETRASAPPRLRLTGLAADRTYRVRLAERETAAPGPDRGAAGLWAAGAAGLELSGAALMRAGLAVPIGLPASAWVIEGAVLATP